MKTKKLILFIVVMVMIMGFNVKVSALETIYSSTIDSINGSRLENYLVYFDYETNGSKSPANQWGYEVAFNSDGIAVETNTNVTIPVGGFVLSAHGTKKTGLMQVKIGDKVTVDLVNKTAIITRDPITANKFMANIRLTDAETAISKAYNAGYDYDIDTVSSLLAQLKSSISELETNDEEKSNTVLDRINNLADTIVYMTSKTKAIESRSVWHRPFGTTMSEETINGIIRLLERFKELGFNTIFLETFWNGYASYRSQILETHPNIGIHYYGKEYGYDYVKAFIGEAKKLGIEVHAWIHTFNAGGLNHKSKVVKDEWLVENYEGDLLHPNTYGGSYYYDPSNPEVLDFVESIILEMASNYDFAGIQLDYIRYYDNSYTSTTIRDSGFGEGPESRFKAAYNLTGDVRTLVKQEQYRNLWFEWRQNNITNAVSRFVTKLREVRPEIVVSAAVVADLASARNTYMQDWFTWVKRGYIDLLAPMIYTGSSQAVRNQSLDIIEKLGNKAYLVSGIAPIYYDYPVYTQHEQIMATDEASGVALFASQNVINLADVEASLKNGRFRSEAININNKASEIVDFALTTLKNNVQNIYLERNLISEETSTIIISQIEKILAMDCANPGDYSEILKEVENLRALGLYIATDSLQATFVSEVDSLANILDIKITRELINYGYWDGNGERPDPTTIEYEVEDPGEEPGKEPGEEPGDNNPETPENPDKENNIKTTILIISLSVLTVMISILSFIIIKRKRVLR